MRGGSNKKPIEEHLKSALFDAFTETLSWMVCHHLLFLNLLNQQLLVEYGKMSYPVHYNSMFHSICYHAMELGLKDVLSVMSCFFLLFFIGFLIFIIENIHTPSLRNITSLSTTFIRRGTFTLYRSFGWVFWL